MNIDHMRAFLEVAATGSFQLAASRLNVTQSTISARIRVLEDRLDRPLFNRRRTGAELTMAGHHFHRYALTAVRAWEQARHEIALPESLSYVIGIGVHHTLWDRIAFDWIERIQARAPDLAIRTTVEFSDALTRLVCDGLLDVAAIYVPQQRPNLIVEKLMEDDLIMVSGTRDRSASTDWEKDYIFVDWGDDFANEHSLAFTERLAPKLKIDHPALALTFVRQRGATAYLLESAVRPYLESGEIFRVKGAPQFRRPTYLAYPDNPIDAERLQLALGELKAIVNGPDAGTGTAP